jgi:prepilin signal peptidase PulO-like enzyme (type II secretory pathway)
LGAIFDHQHFIIPDVTLNGTLLLAIALIVAAPGTVFPGISTGLRSKALLLAGGLAGVILLVVIKNVGELFLRRTEEFGGRMIIDESGIKSIYPNGEKFVTNWQDFLYSKVLPKGNVKVLSAAPASLVAIETACALQDRVVDGGSIAWPSNLTEYSDDSVIIYDESVAINGQKVDLSKGVEIHADSLCICRNGMGIGDIRLMASLGILIGANFGLLDMLFVASCTGTAHGLHLRRKDRRLPFGPHLMVATAYVIASRYKVVPQVHDLLIHLNHAIH